MKKLFVMFATVAAFTLASCGGKSEQKTTENPADTQHAVEAEAKEVKAAGDSATKKIEGATKEGVQEVKEAAKEGAAKVEGATKEGVKEVKEEVKK